MKKSRHLIDVEIFLFYVFSLLEAITDTKTEDSFELNARTLSNYVASIVEFVEENAVVVFELSAERYVEYFDKLIRDREVPIEVDVWFSRIRSKDSYSRDDFEVFYFVVVYASFEGSTEFGLIVASAETSFRVKEFCYVFGTEVFSSEFVGSGSSDTASNRRYVDREDATWFPVDTDREVGV